MKPTARFYKLLQRLAQVRRMHDHEASLEDLFLVIMERLGHDVKTSEDLLGGA